MKRLPAQPAERIDRDAPVTLQLRRWIGRGLRGRHDRLGADGVGPQRLSRSFKYHRPRGELCGCGQCSNSLFQVDGFPGVRGCSEPVAGRDAGGAPERMALARLRRHARDRQARRSVHAGRLLLQDVHPPAPAVAAVREGAAQRRRARQAAEAAGRARVAHRVPPAPLRRPRDRRRHRRPCRGGACGGAGRRRGVVRRRRRAGRHAAGRPAATSTCAELAERARAAGVEILSRAPALGYFDGLVAGLAGRHAAPGARASPCHGDGLDRAAARVPRQRSAGRHARGRRAAARVAVRRRRRQGLPSWRRRTTAASRRRSRCTQRG